jgi:H+/gluconate symporter-like permease
MKTNADNIKNLQDVSRRKLELQVKIATQKEEMLDLVKEIQDSISPHKIIGAMAGGLLATTAVNAIATPSLVHNIGNLSQYFIKDKRKARAFRIALPFLAILTPMVIKWIKNRLPEKEDVSQFFNGLVMRMKSVFS